MAKRAVKDPTKASALSEAVEKAMMGLKRTARKIPSFTIWRESGSRLEWGIPSNRLTSCRREIMRI